MQTQGEIGKRTREHHKQEEILKRSIDRAIELQEREAGLEGVVAAFQGSNHIVCQRFESPGWSACENEGEGEANNCSIG